MPFYEYTCAKCGHHHEELQKVGDPPLKKCPECGRNSLTRLVSAPVFRLKGGGWYETDFKSEQEKKRNLAGDKEAAETTKSSEDKADAAAKPADKPAEKPSGKTTVTLRKPAAAKAPAKVAKAPAKKAAARPRAARKAAGGKRR